MTSGSQPASAFARPPSAARPAAPCGQDELLEVRLDSDRPSASLLEFLQRLPEISRSSNERYCRLPRPRRRRRAAGRATPRTRRVRNNAGRSRHWARRTAPSAGARSRSAPISAGQPRAVRLAQHLDRAHQRGGGRHALEVERLQESRRPAPKAGIVLAHLLEVRTPPAAPAPRPRRRSRGTAPTESPSAIAS